MEKIRKLEDQLKDESQKEKLENGDEKINKEQRKEKFLRIEEP